MGDQMRKIGSCVRHSPRSERLADDDEDGTHGYINGRSEGNGKGKAEVTMCGGNIPVKSALSKGADVCNIVCMAIIQQKCRRCGGGWIVVGSDQVLE